MCKLKGIVFCIAGLITLLLPLQYMKDFLVFFSNGRGLSLFFTLFS
jgi:hypothetical protein